MIPTLLTRSSLAIFFVGAMAGSSVRAHATEKKPASSQSRNTKVTITDLKPFTHTTTLPAVDNLDTFQFESAKAVQVPIRIKRTKDPEGCAALEFRDPGGSINCPRIETETCTAYKVSYSYRGRPFASDEFANDYYTFEVYFRPEELPAETRRAISEKRVSREELASFFTLSASREIVPRRVVDEAQSFFCEQTVTDDFWTRTDPHCRDRVVFKTVSEPADFVTVRVEPASAR